MYRILQIMSDAEVEQCRRIAASAPFIDGKVSNPHNLAKQNEQLHERSAYERSSPSAILASWHTKCEEDCRKHHRTRNLATS